MDNQQLLKSASLLAISSIFVITTGCGGSNKNPTNGSTDPSEPRYSSSLFNANSATLSNRYLPLQPGISYVYEGKTNDGKNKQLKLDVSHLTKTVAGTEAAIVVSREYVDNELIEESFDWLAQDKEGNVWQLGKSQTDYEDDEAQPAEDAWETGKDPRNVGKTATAGIIMKKSANVGDSYQQANYPGIVEELAVVKSLDAILDLPDGKRYTDLVQIQESNALESTDLSEFKYYALDIGEIRSTKTDSSETMNLIKKTDQRNPAIKASNFSAPRLINNAYFSFVPGQVMTYKGYENDELIETVTIKALAKTDPEGDKTVNGIPVQVVRDQVHNADGLLVEDTYDWYAQDDNGNVWYLGEAVTNYEYNDNNQLVETNNEGSFEWGIDGALPGIQMLVQPRVGDSYRQEFYPSKAEDIAAIVGKNVTVKVQNKDYPTLQTLDWNPLDTESAKEYKHYAPGIGLVYEQTLDGSEVLRLDQMSDPSILNPDPTSFSQPRVINNPYFPLIAGQVRNYEVYEDDELVETITWEVLKTSDSNGDKTVNGIPAVVVRDRVYTADNRLIEDTYDWYAQDDNGNVWYLGEYVTNYRYDKDGNLTSTDHNGSFEWGQNGALPGIQMQASPQPGISYRQEYAPGEAEDKAAILALDAKFETKDNSYRCLKTLDWNPLEPDAVREHKYYAKDVGLVGETKLDMSETMVLISVQ